MIPLRQNMFFLPLLKLVSKIFLELRYILKIYIYVCIPRSFVVINVCNQGKTLCSPCSLKKTDQLNPVAQV